MKRYFILVFILFVSFTSYSGTGKAQAVKTSETSNSSVEPLAKKRTQRMKDELFLSTDQCADILAINREMLTRLNKINSEHLDHSAKSKEITGLDNWAKNKIVPILTPAQRQKFESALFAQIYETRIDQKKAVSQVRKR